MNCSSAESLQSKGNNVSGRPRPECVWVLAAEQRSAQAQRHSAKLQQQNAALREDVTASKQLAGRLREQLARQTPCGLPSFHPRD